jgi:small-conductance mechanosensitive channel
MNKKHLLILPFIPPALAISALLYRILFHTDNLLLAGSPAFTCAIICVLVYRISLANNRVVLVLAAAFIFSILGDLFLKLRPPDYWFVLGISSFFLAHAGFSFYSLKRVKFSWPIFAVVLVPFLFWYFAALLPTSRLSNNSVLAFAVFLYVVVSCFSFSASIDLKSRSAASWVYTAGIACILISDCFIAAGNFLRWQKLSFLVMPLYYLCHTLVVLSVVLRQNLAPHQPDKEGGSRSSN